MFRQQLEATQNTEVPHKILAAKPVYVFLQQKQSFLNLWFVLHSVQGFREILRQYLTHYYLIDTATRLTVTF